MLASGSGKEVTGAGNVAEEAPAGLFVQNKAEESSEG